MDRQNKSVVCRLVCRGDYRFAVAFLLIAIGCADNMLWAANVPAESAVAPEAGENSAEKASQAELQKKIAALIGQLGDKDYFVRQKAQEEISRLGFEAFEALTAAATNDDLEIATRAKYLLKLMRVEWADPADPPEVKRLLKGYEMLDDENRAERIHALAVLLEGKGIPALCRLARFEKSDVLSKRAALELLQSAPNGEPPGTQRANLIRKNLDRGARPAVKWINAWLLMARDPQAALDNFKRLIDEESLALQRTPNESNPEMAAAFMRYYIAQLKRLGQNDAVVPAMRSLIALQKDDPTAIAELAEWFLDQKAWDPLEELAKRFALRFASEPIPLYIHAAAKLAQNDAPKAEELASRAFRLNPGKDSLTQHYLVAQYLQKRGCFPWAIREFEYLIAQSNDLDPLALRSVFVLAEIYYDQGRNLEAGRTLEALLKKLSARRLLAPLRGADVPVEQASADMYYYYACHWESWGDRKQQRENIEKAFQADPTNINALIGYYRLSDLTPEEKQKVVKAIRKTADDTRESIRNDHRPLEDPRESLFAGTKEATDCNQLAWLIANTEGDFDEALKYAKRAIELQPGNGGLYDTLAHVYYAKSDFENAVKIQEKALELEPYSGLIKKKLEVFEKALEEKKK